MTAPMVYKMQEQSNVTDGLTDLESNIIPEISLERAGITITISNVSQQ